MKSSSPLSFGLLAVLLAGLARPASAAAYTDGTASLTVTLSDPPGNYSARVDAFWVTDAAGNFIKNIRKDAARRENYLYQWLAARKTTAIDGYSGATISTWTPVTVTWDCRDSNEVVVPDGTYKLYVEFTDRNGQGPWTSEGLPFAKGLANVDVSYPNQTYIRNLRLVYTPLFSRDVAVAAIAAPQQVAPDVLTNVTVTVTNKGGWTETFAVALSDDTDARSLGTNQIVNLGPQAATATTFPWSTANASWGLHSLRAVATPVAGELSLEDNTRTVLSIVAPALTTNIYLTKSHDWRYHDRGVSLGTAWREPDYDDSAWAQGRGPLGYQDPPINTVLNYGGNANAKYPTYYFRAPFLLTTLPTVVTMRLRRDDGAVLYVNGAEAYRTNLPAGTITYTNLALDAVSGADETTYFEAILALTNLVVGTNLMAVEIHQSAANSTDLSFDLELIGAELPSMPAHDVRVLAVAAPLQALPGIATNITVVVTNQGDVAESFPIVLSDLTGGTTIGAQQVTALAAGATARAGFTWEPPLTPWGNRVLSAVAGPVTGELNRTDNTNTLLVLVAPPLETNVLVSRTSLWRYNDTGSDLSFAPWRDAEYFDDSWPTGRGPFGYGAEVATTNSFGPDPNRKYPAYYYRTIFNIDVPPTWLRLRLRCDDGAVVYHNGSEIHRVNLADGPVSYSSWASLAVEGTNALAYFESDVPIANAVIGPNLLAVEVHQVSASDPDLAFDAELISLNPVTPRVHDVAVLAVEPGGAVLIGDRLRLAVTVANRGNASETFTLFLQDANSGQIVASAVVTQLPVGVQSTLMMDWNTLGVSPGQHAITAFTVLDGVTNVTGMAQGRATLSGTAFGAKTTGLAGALGGRCATVAAWGNRLLVGTGATLEVWEANNPLALARLGQVRLPGLIEDIAAAGDFAFVACGNAGVQFVDLTMPSAPRHVTTYDTSGHAYGVSVSGTMLLIADGAAGLRMVSIDAPSAPVLVGAYFTEGPARAVAAEGTRAYLLDAHHGLLVLDIANPADPRQLGVCAFHAGQAVAVANGWAYVIDANNHCFAVDATVPAAPSLVGSRVLTDAVGSSIVINGRHAYVPAFEAGLLVLDIANPADITRVRSLPVPTPGQSVRAALIGDTLYLANGLAGFQALDVTTPESPVVQSDWPLAIRACDVALADSLACVAAGENGLRLYNIANPATPTWVGWSTNALNARCVALAGQTALVGDGQYGLKVFNVGTPTTPALMGSWSGPDLASVRRVGLSGAYGVACDGRTVGLFDLSTPAHPTLVATRPTPAFAFDMAVAGSRIYLACGSAGLMVFEMGPNSLAQVGSYDSPGLAAGVAVSGAAVYLADGPGGWSLLDVSGASPVLVRTSQAEGPVTDVAVEGVLAALGNGLNRAMAMDVTAPLTPVPQTSFDALVQALSLAIGNRQVYVAEDEVGLAIVPIPADVDRDGLPDAWELEIVGADPNDDLRTIQDVSPDDDFDDDGSANAAEYVAGTDPTDRASRFVVLLPPPMAGGVPAIQWSSVAGKTYTIHKSTNLQAGFTVLQEGIAATPPMNTYDDPAPQEAAFYIISVR